MSACLCCLCVSLVVGFQGSDLHNETIEQQRELSGKKGKPNVTKLAGSIIFVFLLRCIRETW